MRWICAAAAPWALAGSVLVSFTAAANNDPQGGVSAASWTGLSGLNEPGFLVPPVDALAFSFSRPFAPPVLQAGLRFELPGAAPPGARELPPRGDLKSGPPPYPEVDRTQKGDPAGLLRPTLSRRAGEVRDRLSGPGARVVFSRDERLLPPTVLMRGSVEAPDLAEPGFEPWNGWDPTTTRQATSIQSPAAAAAGSSGAAAGATTPSVSRAVALSSTTPAPADMTPVEIAAAPVSLPLQSARLDRGEGAANTSVVPKDERPRYADLVDPENLGKEQRCLAEAVYFEARSEPEEGQAAVAQVVLNRVRSGLYPSSICGVVYQNRHRHLACQFTFACEGKALRITEPESWEQAKRVAAEVFEGKTYLADVGNATHYHANYVRPSWSRRLKRTDVIGRHIFYKLRPGQT
ncbi:MAG TPA: cell wall hydrolase [Microvirga sp.]|jgi:spore germination cell wall hydrolase CwlJ-like protein|nr:cell wall hydrolase [Microvirga sp.]